MGQFVCWKVLRVEISTINSLAMVSACIFDNVCESYPVNKVGYILESRRTFHKSGSLNEWRIGIGAVLR